MESNTSQGKSSSDLGEKRTSSVAGHRPGPDGDRRSRTVGGKTDVEWWLLAAEQGEPEAMEALGDYAERHDEPIGGLSAEQWFTRAYEQGSATAATKLGRLSAKADRGQADELLTHRSWTATDFARDMFVHYPVLDTIRSGVLWGPLHESMTTLANLRISGPAVDLFPPNVPALPEFAFARDLIPPSVSIWTSAVRRCSYYDEGRDLLDYVLPARTVEDSNDLDNPAPRTGPMKATRIFSVAVDDRGDESTAGGTNTGDVRGDTDLLDSMIEEARRHLAQLEALRRHRDDPGHGEAAAKTPETVTLESPAGNFDYTLPFSTDESYGSAELSAILSPTDRPHRSLVKARRESNELLGVMVGNQYRFPKFQIDAPRKQIKPVAAYANKLLESSLDPWGALSWWYEQNNDFGDRSPVDLLNSEGLDVNEVSRSLGDDRRGMD